MKKILILLLQLFWVSSALSQGVDPTRPPTYTETQGEEEHPIAVFELDAILISKDKSVAVINGQTVKQGDEIEGAKVISIQPNVVQLDTSGGKITLILLNKY